jgi:hypothetical protein
MNQEFINYVEGRLNQWAEWYSRGNWNGLGYPSCSIEYRLMTEGFVERTSYASRTLSFHEEAEEVEMLVNEMSKQNHHMALALRCHYFTRGGLRTKAKKIEISHMQFKHYVDMAHQWLAGRLSSKKMSKSKYACTVNTKRV